MKKSIITAITAIFALAMGFTSCAEDEGLDITDYRFNLETNLEDTTNIWIGEAQKITLTLKNLKADSTIVSVSQESRTGGVIFLDGQPDKVYESGEEFAVALNDSNQIVLYYVPANTGTTNLKLNVTNVNYTQSIEKKIEIKKSTIEIEECNGYAERTNKNYWLHEATQLANHMYFTAKLSYSKNDSHYVLAYAPCDITLYFNFKYTAYKYGEMRKAETKTDVVALKFEKGKNTATYDVISPVPNSESGSDSYHFYETNQNASGNRYECVNNVRMEVGNPSVATFYYPWIMSITQKCTSKFWGYTRSGWYEKYY